MDDVLCFRADTPGPCWASSFGRNTPMKYNCVRLLVTNDSDEH